MLLNHYVTGHSCRIPFFATHRVCLAYFWSWWLISWGVSTLPNICRGLCHGFSGCRAWQCWLLLETDGRQPEKMTLNSVEYASQIINVSLLFTSVQILSKASTAKVTLTNEIIIVFQFQENGPLESVTSIWRLGFVWVRNRHILLRFCYFYKDAHEHFQN